MTESKITSSTMRLKLKDRYASPEWCLMHEVANSTGAWSKRYADCIAINLFPSRGLAVHGIEIKVSRGDLLSEIAKPEKADEIAKYCDYWYVATPAKLCDPSELPMTWGLIELLDNGQLREKKKALKMKAEPLDRSFVAALARRINQIDEATIEQIAEGRIKAERNRLQDKQEELRQRIDQIPRNLPDMYRDLKKDIERLEAAIGFKINSSSWGSDVVALAKAAELVRRCGMAESYGGIVSLRNTFKSNFEAIEKAIDFFGLEKNEPSSIESFYETKAKKSS